MCIARPCLVEGDQLRRRTPCTRRKRLGRHRGGQVSCRRTLTISPSRRCHHLRAGERDSGPVRALNTPDVLFVCGIDVAAATGACLEQNQSSVILPSCLRRLIFGRSPLPLRAYRGIHPNSAVLHYTIIRTHVSPASAVRLRMRRRCMTILDNNSIPPSWKG